MKGQPELFLLIVYQQQQWRQQQETTFIHVPCVKASVISPHTDAVKADAWRYVSVPVACSSSAAAGRAAALCS